MSPPANSSSRFVMGEATHPGETGKNNEDSYGHMQVPVRGNRSGQMLVAIVADGIGGKSAGEEASTLAVEQIKDYFLAHPDTAGILPGLRQALWNANLAIYRRSQERSVFQDMGTTAAVAVVSDDQLYVANVGDSRVYLVTEETVTQLTTDHSWGQEAVEAGRISPEEARRHPNRNVLRRYLGITPEVEVDLRMRMPGTPVELRGAYGDAPIRLSKGDSVLLCTDGLTDLVADHEIASIVRRYVPQQAADRLVQLARRRGGHDNITVLVLHFGPVAIQAGGPRPRILAAAAGVLVFSGIVLALLGRDLTNLWAAPFSGTPRSTTPPAAASVETTAAPRAIMLTTPLAPTADEQMAATELLAGGTPAPASTEDASPTPSLSQGVPPMSTPVPTRTPIPTRTTPPTVVFVTYTATVAPPVATDTIVAGTHTSRLEINAPVLIGPSQSDTYHADSHLSLAAGRPTARPCCVRGSLVESERGPRPGSWHCSADNRHITFGGHRRSLRVGPGDEFENILGRAGGAGETVHAPHPTISGPRAGTDLPAGKPTLIGQQRASCVQTVRERCV